MGLACPVYPIVKEKNVEMTAAEDHVGPALIYALTLMTMPIFVSIPVFATVW